MTQPRLLRAILNGLDDRQRAAVTAPRGPVRIAAGAGSGKTRVLTRRIAHLVAAGQARANEVVAVSFTVRAAGELRERLLALDEQVVDEAGGAGLVLASARTSTFHAAATRQLAYFWPRTSLAHAHGRAGARSWKLLERKTALIARAADEACLAGGKLDVKEAQGEVEWAKASLIGPEHYLDAVAQTTRTLKSAPEAVAEVYRRYEALKSGKGEQLLDFDDVLLAMIGVLQSSAEAAEELRSWCRCFLVDEFQDVTPLQHELLMAWLGARDNITVVGDPNQTIYSFAGADPELFAGFTRRFPHASALQLDRDYRSTPQVTALANRLVAGGLVGQRPDGPAPEFVEHASDAAEAQAVAERISELIARGTPANEIAVLFRANTHADRFERALRARGVRTGEEGVTLRSLHGAKGLEWDVVFLVALVEGVLPVAWATSARASAAGGRDAAAVAEERRLLYVGITRARERLVLSWYRSGGGRPARPSRFLAALRGADPGAQR